MNRNSKSHKDPFHRWIELAQRKGGYGGSLAYGNADEKRAVECGEVKDWIAAVNQQFGLKVRRLRANSDDPPDFYVSIQGRRMGVEHTQLVTEEHVGRASRGESYLGGKLFRDTQWSQARFHRQLSELIRKKGEKYSRKNKDVEILLVTSAEPWLTTTDVDSWLGNESLLRKLPFENAFLMLQYEPGRGVETRPLFHLFGDLC